MSRKKAGCLQKQTAGEGFHWIITIFGGIPKDRVVTMKVRRPASVNFHTDSAKYSKTIIN